MRIREAKYEDLQEMLEVYLYLHEESIPEDSEQLRSTWQQIIEDNNHHLIVCEVDDIIVSSCVCVIIPNLTRNVRPYAFVENVVTHGEHRGKGYATACLNYAKKIAEDGLLIRDGIHLKVENKLQLEPYLLWYATWKRVGLESEISTPSEYTEKANKMFISLFAGKVKTTF